MAYRIGSFNVCNFALAEKKDLDRIAAIIHNNNLDIVGLQEVLSEGKALGGIPLKNPSAQTTAYERSLQYRLGSDWAMSWVKPKIEAIDYPYLKKDNRNEGYGFLWKKSRFDLIKELEIPHYQISKDQKNMGLIPLKRDPGCGRFKVKSCNAEIRIINIHLLFGKPKAENINVDLDFGAITMRNNEFKVVASRIYPRISQDHKNVECRVPYTIILGDYNLNLKSSGVRTATMPDDVICFDKYGRELRTDQDPYCTIYTVQDKLTTLKDKEPGYANNYDHFSYDQKVRNTIVKSVARIEAVCPTGAPSDDDFATYKANVSDHLPIVLEIDFK